MQAQKNRVKSESVALPKVRATIEQEADSAFTIKVYQAKKQRALWCDQDSDDSFSIEPTNVGAYLAKQQQLHEALQTRLPKRPVASILMAPMALDQTRQMINELRAKHLHRGSSMLPASPMSAHPEPKTEQPKQSESGEDDDFERADAEEELKEETAPLAQKPSVTYSEWQQKHFNTIVQVLERERSESR